MIHHIVYKYNNHFQGDFDNREAANFLSVNERNRHFFDVLLTAFISVHVGSCDLCWPTLTNCPAKFPSPSGALSRREMFIHKLQ
jgi:hypothetical protein